MATLQIQKPDEGRQIPLDGDKFVLGRNPDCAIVIPVTSVSREHAVITRVNNRFFIEDKQSRNGTFVNSQAVTSRTQLKNNDKIRICDFVAVFIEGDTGEDDEEPGNTTVEAMLTQSSHMLLQDQPAERLRGLLEISSSLSKTLQLDLLFPKIGDSLFQLFRQADRCFLILAEEDGKKLVPRLVKTRLVGEETTARFSKSIVRRSVETGQAFLSDDATRDDRVQLSQSVVDFKIRSVMCVPLCAPDGKAFGVIQLDTQQRTKKFTQEDLKLLWGVANQAAVALENARMHEEAIHQEKLRRDLELAHQVQMSFLPRKLPDAPGYGFFAHYEPAMDVGGDYYGFIPLSDGRLAVALGDVAGKGVPAALLMAKLSSDFRFSVLTEPDLAHAVARLNDLLYEFTSQADRFVTLTAAVIDPRRHVATLINAGHFSPLLYRHAAAALTDAVPKKIAGVPLGIMQGYAFESCDVALDPGDSLVLFSDGLPDMVNVANEPFGLPGIHSAILDASGPTTPPLIGERLLQAVTHHASGKEAPDDLTLVCFGREM
jgi:serine phosphatase RsbU (regulator of sigma subunit)/pSer/pThr/pTyr-binding forkhead associated (FHA) protein